MLLVIELVKLLHRLSDLLQGQLRHIPSQSTYPASEGLWVWDVSRLQRKLLLKSLIEFKLPILFRLCGISCFALFLCLRLAVVLS